MPRKKRNKMDTQRGEKEKKSDISPSHENNEITLMQVMVTLPHVAMMILTHLDPQSISNFFEVCPDVFDEMKNDFSHFISAS